LAERQGVMNKITDTGLEYLKRNSGKVIGRAVTGKQMELQQIAHAITQEARGNLAVYISKMDPYKFEYLVQLLLEEMGYNNVEVTVRSGDKGVDVIADIELGISSVREVVQVKRISGSTNRVIVDQLRGSLHRFNAMRGTIITIGSFSTGAKQAALEQGAAPITLIDGNKLLDLLMQYGIGISKKQVEFYEFDSRRLQQFEEEATDLNHDE
jgi:restriction system protein